MSSQFDWQTDAEDSWIEEPADLSDQVKSGSRRLGKKSILITASLVLVTTLIIFAVLIRRADDTANRLTESVLGTHALFKEAAGSRDADLFDTLLLSSDRNWRKQQFKLFKHQLLLNRAPFRLFASAAPLPSGQDVTLSPNLTSAEVAERQTYRTTRGPNASTEIALETITHYRWEDDKWNLAPVEEPNEYWGNWIRTKFGPLEISYSSRDQEISERLARDLAVLVQEICDLDITTCRPDFSLRLYLDRDQGSLAQLTQSYLGLALDNGYQSNRIALPTPSLIGLPVDEAGYEALYRGYAGWIASIMVNRYRLIPPKDRYKATYELLEKWDLRPPPIVEKWQSSQWIMPYPYQQAASQPTYISGW